jgi:type IV pilus assembly protein PilM
MLEFLTLKENAFGLAIGDSSLKIAKLSKKRGGFYLDSFKKMEIPLGTVENGFIKDEKKLVDAIKSAYNSVEGKKIKTKYVAVSLPEEKSFLQVIQMPKMERKELVLAVPLEAENYIPLSIDEVYLDYEIIPPVKNKEKDYFDHIEVLIVAVPKSIVDSYLSCVKKAGFVPVAFEAEGQAIARAIVKEEDVFSPLVLIDLEEDNTGFVVFSGNSVRFTSSIPISSKQIMSTISQSLKISLKEIEKLMSLEKTSVRLEKAIDAIKPIVDDLAKQVKKYINFYRDHSSYEYFLPDGKKEKILLCGSGANIKGLSELLSKKLDMPVEIGNPFTNSVLLPKKIKNEENKNALDFTTAIGLAQRTLNKDSNLQIL